MDQPNDESPVDGTQKPRNHKSPGIQIIADDRDAASGVVEALRLMEDVEVSVQRLSLGDYEVDQQCLFERKTLADFAASVVDGRLFSQAQRLASSGCRVALILEGRTGDLADVGVRREALLGAMVSLCLVFQIPVLRTFDPAETARLMVYAAGQLRQTERGIYLARGKRPRAKRKLQSRILQGLPGIGPERAERLLDIFGSVEAVINAGPDELRTVEGIGEKTAAAIRWALE